MRLDPELTGLHNAVIRPVKDTLIAPVVGLVLPLLEVHFLVGGGLVGCHNSYGPADLGLPSRRIIRSVPCPRCDLSEERTEHRYRRSNDGHGGFSRATNC